MKKFTNLVAKIFIIIAFAFLSCAKAMEEAPDIKKIKCGVHGIQGRRPAIEDAHAIKIYQDSKPPLAFFGVFDGHSYSGDKGLAVANYLAKNLLENILSIDDTEIKNRIKEGFLKTNQEILSNEEFATDGGSTAVTAFIIGNKLIIANAGDSRAIVSKNGKVDFFTTDHKPNNPSEKQRIEDEDGFVHNGRVCRLLSTSRAFGNIFFKQMGWEKCIKPVPDIKIYDLSSENDFLILACDGLWDVTSNENALQMVKEIIVDFGRGAQEASQVLVNTAYASSRSTDNITAIIVDLREYAKDFPKINE